jgi:hypothetical protein
VVAVVFAVADVGDTAGDTRGVTPYFFRIARPPRLNMNLTNAFAAASWGARLRIVTVYWANSSVPWRGTVLR